MKTSLLGSCQSVVNGLMTGCSVGEGADVMMEQEEKESCFLFGKYLLPVS